MKKDFITATPDSGGSGSTTVTAAASANQTESSRSVNLSVAGGGMTRTVGASQAAGVVTWNYYFSVTPTSLKFVAGGESKTITVSSYRKKVINGVETSTQENVTWTATISGTGFSKNTDGTSITAASNQSDLRSGSVSYTQGTSEKTASVSLSQAAGVVTWNYYFSVTPTSLKFVAGGESKTITVSSYRKKVINGVETSTQENVTWTATISGTGFSKNTDGTSITAASNQSDLRSGSVSYTQGTSEKTASVSLSQVGVEYTITYKSNGSFENDYLVFNSSSTPTGKPMDYRILVKGMAEIEEPWKPNPGYLVNDVAQGGQTKYLKEGDRVWVRKITGMPQSWSGSTTQSFILEANNQTVQLN